MLQGAALLIIMATLVVAIGLMTVLIRTVRASIEKDIRALLPQVAASLVRSSVRLLKQDDRAEVLAWFEGEYLDIRSKGGTGVGIALAFLVIVMHRAVVSRAVGPRIPR